MSSQRHKVAGSSCNTVDVLQRISPGTPVDIWFDDSGFRRTSSQFLADNQAAFSGGSLDGGLTYINPSDIRAVRIGVSRR